MVVALGPGKFYGSSLPRPRIYTDIKFSDERVDPPVSVVDPFMSWAEEAHWSMGGLRLQRHRLQGRIEGNVKKLRAEREKSIKKRVQISATYAADHPIPRPGKQSAGKRRSPSPSLSPSPPPVPILTKRRRFMALIDEDDDEENEPDHLEKVTDEANKGVRVKRSFARKLVDDFDRVAVDSGLRKSGGSPEKISGDGLQTVVVTRTRSRKLEKVSGHGGTETKIKAVEVVKKSNSEGYKSKGNGKKAQRSGANGDSSPKIGTRTSQRVLKRGPR